MSIEPWSPAVRDYLRAFDRTAIRRNGQRSHQGDAYRMLPARSQRGIHERVIKNRE